MNINEIINDVVSRVNPEWPTLYKIRFVYVELGKFLQKNTDFFFSVDKKLGENNLTFEEIASIYNEETVLSTEVICRSASRILKMALDKLNIESRLVKSINNVMPFEENGQYIDINHWFLVVNDGVDWYFCTLSSDLPYIQMGLETKHFGVNIPYIKQLSDGTESQVYEGEEVKHTVLSRETLKEVDEEIGYVRYRYKYNDASQVTKDWILNYNNASFYMLRDSIRGNKLFNEIEINKTDFYQDLLTFEGDNHRKISLIDEPLSSVTDKDWEKWIKIVANHILNKICEIIGYEIVPIPPIESKDWNYEAWLFNLCVQIEEEIYARLDYKEYTTSDTYEIDVENFKYNKWSKKVKKAFIFDSDYEYSNIIVILDKMNALINCVRSHGKNGNIGSLVNSLAYHFIDERNLMSSNILEDGMLSSYYIANKFESMFARIFSCNEEITDLNAMSYSEQVVIIKDILPIMFPEITVENSHMMKGYDERYVPVLNRIQLYPVKHRETGDYAMIFSILGEEDADEYYFFFNPKTNEFRPTDILSVYMEYSLVSNRLKSQIGIEELENMDQQRKK